MADIVRNEYVRLFEIRILHHYWLDEGSTLFDLIPSRAKKNERLLSYDVRSYLTLTPSAASMKALKCLGCVYKTTATGCIVGTPKDAIFEDSACFEFIVTVRDPAFYNYTALTLTPQRITGLYYQPEKATYRYKANVPVLSNMSGAYRESASGKTLFLSSEIPALTDGDKVEALVASGNALLQLTSDQPGAAVRELTSDRMSLPAFVHQGDVPVIVTPDGLAGAPERGIRLREDIPDNVFALVQLTARRTDDEAFSFVNSTGKAKSSPPVFEIRFKNRSTSWRYFDKRTGFADPARSTDPDPLPLTYYGNADLNKNQKPSEGTVKIEKTGNRITRLVSDVYV